MNLCYRTYRLRARCVFEMFSSFLITKVGEQVRPALMVRSGDGTPNWISPLECLKLAVGTSIFECCVTNHTKIKTCQKAVARSSLNEMIISRANALFDVKEFALARCHKTLRVWWLRGLQTKEDGENLPSSLDSFLKYLRWNVEDGEWFDRCGISIFMYTVACSNVTILRELLHKLQSSDPTQYKKRLRGEMPAKGVTSLGIPGRATTLVYAMGLASSEFVSLLLEYDADPYESDVAGNDGLMLASILGRTDNVKFWLKRFPDWNLERKNKILGGVALGSAVYMGPHRLEIVKVLLEHGASLNFRNETGGAILTSICSSEDGDPELLNFLLKKKMNTSVNYRARGRTAKWKLLYRLARFLIRNKLTKSGLMTALAQDSGSTALHYAVQRGDIDCVNLLLKNGADPAIKNDLGKTPVDYCDAFPELRGALKRVVQRRKSGKPVTLYRRNSTATDMKFPMYLVPLDQLQRLYGGKVPRNDRIEAHQELLRRGELVRWIDLPIDSHIIFFSHEWVGWNHPDPDGIQLKTFLRVMQRLRSGEISQVEMNVFHTLMYVVFKRKNFNHFTFSCFFQLRHLNLKNATRISHSQLENQHSNLEVEYYEKT